MIGTERITDAEILAMWDAGFDTKEMATMLFMREADLANRLPRVRERARQDAEWNFDSTAPRE